MAKKSMWAREAKRDRTVAKYAKRRDELKAIVKDRSASHEAIDEKGKFRIRHGHTFVDFVHKVIMVDIINLTEAPQRIK